MKKLLLIVVSCCFLLPAFADEEVYLDLNAGDIHQYKTFSPQIDNEKKEKTDDFDTDMVFHPFKYIKEDASELYSKKTITNKKEKTIGKAKFGAKYDTTINPDSVSQKRTLYTNYDITEKMSVGADYQTDSLSGVETQTKGSVGIGPEFKLTDKLKLKNKYSKNFGNDSNKGEVSVEYKPFKDGRMDFNAGAAQTQQDNGPGSSQINFGTNFRF
jgi:ABC-type Fe3+/spermidine/putrescine transport system ATPase subunit